MGESFVTRGWPYGRSSTTKKEKIREGQKEQQKAEERENGTPERIFSNLDKSP